MRTLASMLIQLLTNRNGQSARRAAGFVALGVALTVAAFPSPATAQPTVDHYLCYKGRDLKDPRFAPVAPLELTDQFVQLTGATALKLSRLCVPVDKSGSGILDTGTHLCEYKLKLDRTQLKEQLPKDSRPHTRLTPENAHFPEHAFEVRTPQTLLVPCRKEVVCVSGTNVRDLDVDLGDGDRNQWRTDEQNCLGCVDQAAQTGGDPSLCQFGSAISDPASVCSGSWTCSGTDGCDCFID